MNQPLRVVTWNINGIRAREPQFLELLAAVSPDVVCLQEIKCPPDKLPSTVTPLMLPDYWGMWHGTGGYSGVALLFRRSRFPTEPRFDHPPFDMENRIVEARMDGITFASVYVPNGGKDFEQKTSFLRQMASYIAASHAVGATHVLCGDLNVTRTDEDVHPTQRNRAMLGQRPDERKLLQELLEKGLVDVGRSLDPDNPELFTWWPFGKKAKKLNLGWRLDYVLASPSIAETASNATVHRDFGTSDHAPVIVDFK